MDIEAQNVPVPPDGDTTMTLYVLSETEGLQTVTAAYQSGDEAFSTWQTDVTFSHGFSWGMVNAAWTP